MDLSFTRNFDINAKITKGRLYLSGFEIYMINIVPIGIRFIPTHNKGT
jgi:hypothetical protein